MKVQIKDQDNVVIKSTFMEIVPMVNDRIYIKTDEGLYKMYTVTARLWDFETNKVFLKVK